jgi:hypothetical protein
MRFPIYPLDWPLKMYVGPRGVSISKTSLKAHPSFPFPAYRLPPFQTKAPEGFPSVHDINRPQRHRCRFLQALCLFLFSFYRDFGMC